MIGICSKCGKEGAVEVHHIDGNHDNDIASNRVVICRRCHHLAHIELLLAKTGRPGTKPISDRVYGMPPVDWQEVKRQYQLCFPRA